MSAGGYQQAGVQPRLRAAVNARLEEISFRAGLVAATIALVALSTIAAGGVYAITLGLRSHTVAASAGTLSATGPAKTMPTATASARPIPPEQPRVTATPKATHPVTAGAASPQLPTGSQPWPQGGGPQGGAGYFGRGGHTSWPGGHGAWDGGSLHGGQGFGFPGQGGRGRP